MSTTIVELEGKTELRNLFSSDRNVTYAYGDVTISTFYGGETRGKCIQITLATEDENKEFTYSHVQLDNETAKKLLEALKQLDF